jgi:ubiquinol-cytochrome c reductase cytochrome b subunit
MLRCIPHKAAGIITMLGSIIFLLFLPLINRSIIKNPKFKPLAYRQFIILWFFNFIALIYLGGQPIHEIYTPITQVCTLYYFIFWVVYIPLIHLIENNELQLNLHAKKK